MFSGLVSYLKLTTLDIKMAKRDNRTNRLRERLNDKASAHQSILQLSEAYENFRKPLRIIAVDLRTGQTWG